ncbi:MAG: hypothetical protein OT477_13955 [Chloroflexi bacterium]|nr:hypothetical protein [Chloroflexota bacterium]
MPIIRLIIPFWRNKHKLVFICLLFLFLFFLLSCTNNSETSIETPINIKKEEPITITALHEIISIPDGYIKGLSWDEQNNLRFRINQEDWSVNAIDLNVIQINQNIDDDTPSNQFEELPPIPDGILENSQTLLSTSPSGKIHIFIEYVEQLSESEQIDGEQVVGEVIYPPAPLMIGIFHDGEKKNLGTIFSCRHDKPTSIIWPENERSFVIRNNCSGNSRVWLYSFDQDILQEVDNLGSGIDTYGFSPNGTYFLYRITISNGDGTSLLQLYLVRLSDLSSWKFNDLLYAEPIDWLSEHEVIIAYDIQPQGRYHHYLGVYNINTGDTYSILPTHLQNLGQITPIDSVFLSSDKSYIAFTTMVRPFQESNLWIGKLEPNH